MPNFIDMTGWKMWEHGVPNSRLEVLHEDPSNIKGKAKKWIVKCNCDKQTIFSTLGAGLRNGNTTSCGCKRTESLIKRNTERAEVQVGKTYGRLTVIEDLGFRQQSSRDKRERWSLCQCSCGSKPIEIANNRLQNGNKKSCGCLSASYGEEEIKKILDENNIQYITQYYFNDLYTKRVCDKLRFDFAVFKDNNLSHVIEFDGRQHFMESFENNGETLEDRQYRDNLKNQYCKEHNIPLIRLDYTMYNKITLEDLMIETSNFIVS